MSTLMVVQLLEVALNLAMSVGINVQKLMAMRQLSADGHLTAQQIAVLAEERDAAINKM